MSAHQAQERQGRQGKASIVLGVAALLVGLVLQAVAAQSVAGQAPPMFVANAGSTAFLGEMAGLVMLGGAILAVVGIIRYAQSGSDGSAVMAPAPADRTSAVTFCSSCGDRLAGEGRYCSSCGTPTAR